MSDWPNCPKCGLDTGPISPPRGQEIEIVWNEEIEYFWVPCECYDCEHLYGFFVKVPWHDINVVPNQRVHDALKQKEQQKQMRKIKIFGKEETC
jgi:hypothetical protein